MKIWKNHIETPINMFPHLVIQIRPSRPNHAQAFQLAEHGKPSASAFHSAVTVKATMRKQSFFTMAITVAYMSGSFIVRLMSRNQKLLY